MPLQDVPWYFSTLGGAIRATFNNGSLRCAEAVFSHVPGRELHASADKRLEPGFGAKGTSGQERPDRPQIIPGFGDPVLDRPDPLPTQ